jgi:omega-6 fatty acid desaturase (delta-12 desaturase)
VRTGPELVRASQEFATEDVGKSWGLLGVTFAVFAALWAMVIGAPSLLPSVGPLGVSLIGWGGSLILGLVGVRFFIFYHDYHHGAIFRGSQVAKVPMTLVGFYTLAVPTVWKETHDFHHRNNAKLTGSSIGSYPTVSLGMYKGIKPRDRQVLKVVRHPVTILLGLLTTFFVGFCIASFRRDPKQHWAAPVSGVVWILTFLALGYAIDWTRAVQLWMLPTAIHSAAGSYLFYAQHNFPGCELRDRRSWEYSAAALKSSSMFDMNPLMHWFTGNIGYHHVHHLNHRIPFYRLPEAMAQMPELQSPGRTSWSPRDIWACLHCSVWDPESGKLISFAEADARLGESAAAAPAG